MRVYHELNILLISDKNKSAALIGIILEAIHYTYGVSKFFIELADSVQKSINALENFFFDFVLLDLSDFKKNILKTFKKLHDKSSDSVFIILTVPKLEKKVTRMLKYSSYVYIIKDQDFFGNSGALLLANQINTALDIHGKVKNKQFLPVAKNQPVSDSLLGNRSRGIQEGWPG